MNDGICSFPDCGRPIRCRALCSAHYRQELKGKVLKPLVIGIPRKDRICSYPDCGRKVKSLGMCASHYGQTRAGEELRPHRDDRPPRICSFPECGRKHCAAKLCNAHYAQYLSGQPLKPLDLLRNLSPAERFPHKVDKSGTCHIWTGGKTAGGYGLIGWNGTTEGAHRVAWKLAYGDIADDLQCDHLCHVPACVDVNHLRLATRDQNLLNRPGSPDYSLTDVEGVFFMGRWQLRAHRFRAVLSGSGLSVMVGHYPALESAALALEEAKAGYQLALPGMERLSDVYGVTA